MTAMLRMPRLLLVAAALLVGAATAAPTASAEQVDLELVLAVDVSGSIDDAEAQLQRDGFVAAFRDDRVLRVIQSGRRGRIAVAYMEWAGTQHRENIVGWTVVHDRASADAFAQAVARAPLTTALWTSISGAVDHAMALMAISPHQGRRRVIDISGDDPNNHGEFVLHARARALGAGLVVNGLPIINGRPSRYGLAQLKNLDLYFEDCVIGGPGAFLIVAHGFHDFARAIRRKLILEIAGTPPPRRPAAVVPVQARERPPCDAGERQIRDYIEDF